MTLSAKDITNPAWRKALPNNNSTGARRVLAQIKAQDRKRAKPLALPWSAVLDVQVRSEMNLRQHWSARVKRKQAQRNAVHLALPVCKVPLPLKITLTKLGGRKMDQDNLRCAFKAVVDSIAEQIGVDDGDERIEWAYAPPEKGAVGVRIEIQEIVT